MVHEVRLWLNKLSDEISTSVFYYGEDEDRVSEMKELSSNRGSLAGDFYFVQINKAEYIENLISAFAEVGN